MDSSLFQIWGWFISVIYVQKLCLPIRSPSDDSVIYLNSSRVAAIWGLRLTAHMSWIKRIKRSLVRSLRYNLFIQMRSFGYWVFRRAGLELCEFKYITKDTGCLRSFTHNFVICYSLMYRFFGGIKSAIYESCFPRRLSVAGAREYPLREAWLSILPAWWLLWGCGPPVNRHHARLWNYEGLTEEGS